MQKMQKILLVLAAVGFLGSGCIHHHRAMVHHPHGMPPGQAKKVVHVHGHACGHVLVDGVWIVVR